MKDKRKSVSKKELQKEWEKAAVLFENEKTGLEAMRESRVVSGVELRHALGRGGRNKLISIRLPEEELSAVKKIAQKHGRKYQQLIGEALSQFLDRYEELQATRKKTGT